MKTIKYFFEFITVITLFFIFKIIGLKNASNLGGMMGKFFGPLFRSKSITKKNIKSRVLVAWIVVCPFARAKQVVR